MIVLRIFWQIVLCLLFLSVVGPSCLEAQQGRGTISGTVSDPSGAAVPDASVAITNVRTNATFTTQTNAEGLYTAPGLAVGDYIVSAERQGFKRAVRKGVTLQVDQKAHVNLTMDVGGITDTVEVVVQTPLVDAGSATLGAVIENRRMSDLPLKSSLSPNAPSLVYSRIHY